MEFDLPRDEVFAVDAVDVRLDPAPHPFIAGREDDIARNWALEKAQTPSLFDGEVALLSRLSFRGGLLMGRCHLVRYSAFLYWRRLRPVPFAEHSYAHAVLVSADDALVAIRMGPRTANPGLVYFAAGSFEPADFRDGVADLDFNMHREVLEETGLDIAAIPSEPRFHALSVVTGTVIFRRYFLPMIADEIETRIAAFVAAQSDPEIAGAVIMRRGRPLPNGLAAQMPGIVNWHFSTSAR